MVDDVASCYAARSVSCAIPLWSAVPGEIRRLHRQSEGQPVPVAAHPRDRAGRQDRRGADPCFEMHRHAELGVAAHWRYKEGGAAMPASSARSHAMRQLLEGKDARDDDAVRCSPASAPRWSRTASTCWTPKAGRGSAARRHGARLRLRDPHTDVGHRRGAKVNGRIVPLELPANQRRSRRGADRKMPEPRRDWLSPHHGFFITHRAREKVMHLVQRIDLAQNLAAGRTLLERELKRLALHHADLTACRSGSSSGTSTICSAPRGSATPYRPDRVPCTKSALRRSRVGIAPPALPVRVPSADSGAIASSTVSATCCASSRAAAIHSRATRSPATSRGARGVSVHRADCAQLGRLRERDESRVVASGRVGIAQAGRLRRRHTHRRAADQKWLH